MLGSVSRTGLGSAAEIVSTGDVLTGLVGVATVAGMAQVSAGGELPTTFAGDSNMCDVDEPSADRPVGRGPHPVFVFPAPPFRRIESALRAPDAARQALDRVAGLGGSPLMAGPATPGHP